MAAIEFYCERRNDPETSDQLRVEAQVEPTTVTIVERRAPWSPDLGQEWPAVGVARRRYTATKRERTLQSSDSNGRWSRYEYINPVARVDVLLNEIDRDPPASSGSNPPDLVEVSEAGCGRDTGARILGSSKDIAARQAP